MKKEHSCLPSLPRSDSHNSPGRVVHHETQGGEGGGGEREGLRFQKRETQKYDRLTFVCLGMTGQADRPDIADTGPN